MVDLAQERRIRGTLDELRRLLTGHPERAARMHAWLDEEDDMNEKLITLRLPADLFDQARGLVDVIGATGDFAAVRVTVSTVIRLALIRGLAALRDEFGDDAGPSQTTTTPVPGKRAQ